MMASSEYCYYPMHRPTGAVRNKRAISTEESRAYVIDLKKINNDGRTTVMVRNIPNKYTQDMLLDLFKKHKKKFDFFYLPIDYNVPSNAFRTTATWAMPSSTSSAAPSSPIFTASSTGASGTSSTRLRCAKCGTPVSRALPSWSITLSTPMCCSRRRRGSDP